MQTSTYLKCFRSLTHSWLGVTISPVTTTRSFPHLELNRVDSSSLRRSPVVFSLFGFAPKRSYSTSREEGKDCLQESPEMSRPMRVLNVAEKNDAAKRIAHLLSGGNVRMKNGLATYNKIYEFQYQLWGRPVEMAMTSVSGHLLGYDFSGEFRSWQAVDPVELFDAPVIKKCPDNYAEVKANLEREAPYASVLIIWTDCDREGENIGFEVIEVCKKFNARLQIHRAKFSEITPQAVTRAINNLVPPDKKVSDAVDVRSELDLRIGAAFTRFQTLRLQRVFPGVLMEHLISYGSCQFPTLGFVVERYKAIQNFIPEDFWKIEVTLTVEQCLVDFSWARVRLFDRTACLTILDRCEENPEATVTSVKSKPKNKWRPVALDTVEFEKLASRKLKIGAKDAMKIAESLYTKGIISYPRTETNIFPQGLDLRPLIQMQTNNGQWGGFAGRLAAQGPNPRNGKKSDQAHPPIHPTKTADELTGNEKRIYELIVRHFLACCSKDAVGQETIVEIEIAEERFVAHGLTILERNYLEVYPYDKWADKELPRFQEGQKFMPSRLEMTESSTSPPSLLTEADLISLMEKHGIGTDATHAEHIETIKSRMYVGVQGDGRFVPGQLGMGLVEGYDSMGFEMSKPHLRAGLEADLKKICDGVSAPSTVLREQVQKYRDVFVIAAQQVSKLDQAVGHFLNQDPRAGGAARNPGGGAGPPPRPRGPPPGGGGGGGGGGFGGGSPPGGSGSFSGGDRGYGTGSGSSGGNRPFSNPPTSSGGDSYTCPPPCCTVLRCFTVRKEGPNTGRQFYRCDNCSHFKWQDELGQPSASGSGASSSSRSNPGNSYQPPSMPPPSTRPPMSSTQHNGRGGGAGSSSSNFNNRNNVNANSNSGENSGILGIPKCTCGITAASRIVLKDTPNKGRYFFCCATGLSGGCNFFEWDDAGIGESLRSPKPMRGLGRGQSTRGRGRSGRGQPRSRANNTFDGNASSSQGRKTRRCGVCNEEGHTRRNCTARKFSDEEDVDFGDL